MTTPSARLREAGLQLPPVPAPVGSYVQARCHGSTVHVTGQLAFVDGAIPWPGRVGEEVSVADGAEAARVAALNALAAAAAEVGDVDRLTGVIEVVGYTACAQGFDGLSAVLNGASDLFPEIFGESGRHVRTNVGVAWLPLGSPVEVRVVFERHLEDDETSKG